MTAIIMDAYTILLEDDDVGECDVDPYSDVIHSEPCSLDTVSLHSCYSVVDTDVDVIDAEMMMGVSTFLSRLFSTDIFVVVAEINHNLRH
jgi:hypothetical protein